MSKLVLKNVGKSYGNFEAVVDFSLELKTGEFVSLLGPSGCGKTTTLRMIAGFVPPTTGTIAIEGDVISTPNSVVPPEKRRMSMIFQSYAIWPNMTVGENVAFGLRMRGELALDVDTPDALLVVARDAAQDVKKVVDALAARMVLNPQQLDVVVASNLFGDILTDLDVAALVRFHRSRSAEGTLHLTPVDDPSQYGVVETDAGGWVRRFVEKPAPGETESRTINAGTYVLEPSVIDRIPHLRRTSVEREVFPAMAAEGRLAAMVTDDYWIDTGRPDTYLQANLEYYPKSARTYSAIARCSASGSASSGNRARKPWSIPWPRPAGASRQSLSISVWAIDAISAAIMPPIE